MTSDSRWAFGIVVLVMVVTCAFALPAAAAYHVIRRIQLPGNGGWDYITADTQARRLYVPHGTEVLVLDLDSGDVVGRITGLKDVHGVALAPEFSRGFISATDPGSVTIFNTKTLAVIKRVRVGNDPNGIIYDPKLHCVFSADRGSKRLTAIDARTGRVVGKVNHLGGRTEHLASDEAGHVFLNMQSLGTTLKIDAVHMKILRTFRVDPPCGQPSSMDMDREHNRVFLGCRGGGGLLAVLDADSGKVVATQPIGPGVDALEFDPATGRIYVSTGGGKGVLWIFHEDSPNQYSLLQRVQTLPGARTMALDRKTGKVYLPVSDLGPAPAPTRVNPRPRSPHIPGTFSVLVVGP